MEQETETPKYQLIRRLDTAHPGWPVWDELLALVHSLNFRVQSDPFLGRFLASGNRLAFRLAQRSLPQLDWVPSYVQALQGMKAAYWEMAGGYADMFTGAVATPGGCFSPSGNDRELGFPELEIPEQTYVFQCNQSGALFFVNPNKEVMYPGAAQRRFVVLDDLDSFTQECIRAAVQDKPWFRTYAHRCKGLTD